MEVPKTRLIVKNVPKHVDEKRLWQHFAERGEVSDAKIVRTKDGKSRQFAFVGFTTESDAEEALKYYNQTFLDTSRIQVELAQPKGNAGIARPWSKHSEGSSRAQKLAEAKARKQVKAKDEKRKTDESCSAKAAAASARGKVEKEEFMAALKKRSEARFWDNDDALLEQAQAAAGGNIEDREGASSDATSSDDDRASVDNQELSDGTDSDAESPEEGTLGSTSRSKEKRKAGGGSDMDWLRSKVGKGGAGRGKVKGDEASASKSESEGDEEGGGAGTGGTGSKGGASGREGIEKPERNAQTADGGHSDDESDDEKEEEESGLSVGRLFVRNLPYTCTEDDLRDLFGSFGMLSEVHLPVDDVKKGKGFAFVQFVIPEDAEKALEQLDRHAFHGRLLHIMPARKQPGSSGAEASGTAGRQVPAAAAGKSYKEKKEMDRRARAGDTVGWNASFVRSDTVVDALADRLGVGKSDILDREEGDMAVRLALGETLLVKENKEYFEKEGVDLSVLESTKGKGSGRGADERSSTVILVKNLPYSAEAAELAKRFGAFGDVGRVLLPPSKTVALVEFLAASDAKKAFKRLACARFQHVLLYLEWAPLKAFKDTFEPSSKPASLPASEKAATGEEAKVDEDEVAAGRASKEPLTMFVKNLSFSTTEAGLRNCFEKAGLQVRSVSIPRKKGPGASEATLSMGFGFVECADASLVEKSLKTLQGTVLDGHALELKRSTKRLTPATKASSSSSSQGDGLKRTKIIIRNIPFQATAKEIRELCSSFGQLKRVRLPKKFDGGHRGFAFVDFLTAQEAMGAKKSLESTHFYGRHLVGEWAEDGEDMDALRAKAARDLRGPSNGGRPAKRQKTASSGDDFANMDD
ncbi:unnamed protein product [Ectocarpus sp. CCAP 1310/34]|nr:unnamed protein product [Ectocarpus sp. CCAP 1310/34]